MWYCYRRDYLGEPELPHLIKGCWYEQAAPPDVEDGIPTAYLTVEGLKTRVHLEDFMQREEKADYSWADEDIGSGGPLERGEPMSFETLWVPVCPEGHQGAAQTSYPTQHECSECETTYPVQLEDSGLVLGE